MMFCSSALAMPTLKTCSHNKLPKLVNEKLVWNTKKMNALNAITVNAGFELVVQYGTPFVRCMKLLASEKVDVVTGLIYTPERQKLWYLLPYAKRFSNGIYVVKSREDLSSFDMATLNIGAIKDYIIPDSHKHLEPNLVRVGTPEQGMRMLLRHRFDAFILSEKYFNEINKLPELNNKFRLQSIIDADEFYYLAFPKSKKGLENFQKLKQSSEELVQKNALASLTLGS